MFNKEILIKPVASFLLSYLMFCMLIGFEFFNPFKTINAISFVGSFALIFYLFIFNIDKHFEKHN